MRISGTHLRRAAAGALGAALVLVAAACSVPQPGPSTAPSASTTGGGQPTPNPAPRPMGVAEAQQAADQMVAGWRAAHKRAWDPKVWDAVDAYPNRITDGWPIAVASGKKKRGTYKPATRRTGFKVTKVYAHTIDNGTESLVALGYHLDAKKKPVIDSDAIHLYVREAAGPWRFAGLVGSWGIRGTTKAGKSLLASFTPVGPLPVVDSSRAGANAKLLDVMVKAASTGRAPGVKAKGTSLRAGTDAWGGGYDRVRSSRCTVPKGSAIATFQVKEATLSLVQLDCQIRLAARPRSYLWWTHAVTGKRVTGDNVSGRVLSETLVRTTKDGYVVVARSDHWASLPVVTR